VQPLHGIGSCRGKSELHRAGCRPRTQVQDRGQRRKPSVTDSATESIPLRFSGARVKRRCKRPPGIPAMAYALKTSPKQGRIGKLFRKNKELPAQFRKESFRVGRTDKWLQFYHLLVIHRIRLTASVSAFFIGKAVLRPCLPASAWKKASAAIRFPPSARRYR